MKGRWAAPKPPPFRLPESTEPQARSVKRQPHLFTAVKPQEKDKGMRLKVNQAKADLPTRNS